MRGLRAVFFLCWFFLQSGFAQAADTPLADLSADSVILIEANTGNVVYEKNAAKRIYPASTTKMMTAIIALENGKLDDVVTVGKDADGAEGSAMNIAAGDKLYFKDLLYGVMMASGNDATIAIADYLSGSVEEFAKLMTKKAHEIGAVNTNFVNSSGLPDKNHYSTAYDLARIAMYAYRNDQFRELVATAKQEIKWLEPVKSEILENTNLLLHNYQGATGIKTGYTEAAGECLVASAQRNGVDLIAVVMHVDKDKRFDEAAKLLDYGFERVKLHVAFKKNDLLKTINVRNGRNHQMKVRPKDDILYPIVDGINIDDFSIAMDMPKYVTAPVKQGQAVGSVRILYRNIEIGKVEMVADQAVVEGFNPISLLIMWYEALFETLKSFGFK